MVAVYVLDEDEEVADREDDEGSTNGEGSVKGANCEEEAAILLALLLNGADVKGFVMETYGVVLMESSLPSKVEGTGDEKPGVVLVEELLWWWW